MPKYHVGYDGNYGICTAKIKCRYGSEEDHFDSLEEVQAFRDEIYEYDQEKIEKDLEVIDTLNTSELSYYTKRVDSLKKIIKDNRYKIENSNDSKILADFTKELNSKATNIMNQETLEELERKGDRVQFMFGTNKTMTTPNIQNFKKRFQEKKKNNNTNSNVVSSKKEEIKQEHVELNPYTEYFKSETNRIARFLDKTPASKRGYTRLLEHMTRRNNKLKHLERLINEAASKGDINEEEKVQALDKVLQEQSLINQKMNNRRKELRSQLNLWDRITGRYNRYI